MRVLNLSHVPTLPHNVQLSTYFSCFRSRYVNDPRNTDNAWIETIATWFHCSASLGDKLVFNRNESAEQVEWIKIDQGDLPKLYARHHEMVERVLAHWKWRRLHHVWLGLPAILLLGVAIYLLVEFTA